MATRRYHRHRRLVSETISAVFNRRMAPKLITAGGVFLLIGAGTVMWWSRDLPDPHDIGRSNLGESTKIFDASGQHLLYEIGEARRTYVPITNISTFIKSATLAAEDDQFYEHHGLDFFGIARGVVLKPLSGRRAQGGSTITQQLIKNAILSSERTVQRKVKEAVLALELEQRFSKDEILEMYLNAIPYGSRSYGVEAAAQTFFGTSAANVSLAQATIIASLPQAPTYYSPYGSHMEDLKIRQEHILGRMVQLGMISQDEADRAKQEELHFLPARESIQAPHFVFYVKEQLEEEFGERVVEEGGLRVVTTLDMRLQLIAEETLHKNQERLTGRGASNAALVAVNPSNGDILAMAGSVDYFNEEIDGNVNVAVRHRSPGSSIKPFVYAAAFARGFTPETILVDAETDFGKGYTPKNYNLKENGPVTMRAALANSLNIPAVKTLYLAGVKEATQLAHDMGMESLTDPDRYGLSLVLGGGEVRLLDLTSSYGVFAADGVRYPQRNVLKVERGNEILYDASTEGEPAGTQVLDEQIARLTTNILSDNNARALTFGTGSPLQLGSRPVAAKTGTAQDFRDGWTAGFTPSIAAGVWTGNNDNSPMHKGSDGVYTAAPIWNAFMRAALEGTPIETFTRPEPLQNIPHGVLRGEMPEIKAKYIPETGEVVTLDCPIAQGQNRTFKELHDVLYYVRRTNPLGPPPANAESDAQFDNWETGVSKWRDKHRLENKDKPGEPVYVSSLPVPTCGVENAEDLPKVIIEEPDTSTLTESPTIVKVSIDSKERIKEVRFLLDNKEIARRGPGDPYEARVEFDSDFSGRKVLLVLAITEDNLIGRAHRTFTINPDGTKPQVTLHTPQNGSIFKPESFPQTVKITAKDASGIDLVDVLYTKEGHAGTGRIGRTSEKAKTAADRYEVTWSDSPGPGTYHVYAIVYDKTGNSTQTPEHTVVVE